jgi:hypothetical protein
MACYACDTAYVESLSSSGLCPNHVFFINAYAIDLCSWQCARRVTLRMSSLSPRDESEDDDEEAEFLKSQCASLSVICH